MEQASEERIRLSAYSHGAGCGCKLSPSQLREVMAGLEQQAAFPQLLVGTDTRDDAAVFDLGSGELLVSTVDFFMPILDDPYDFGRIASVNAINDVYAMGATPLFALAMLGWPVSKLPAAAAAEVLKGAQEVCSRNGIPLAGGHSIDNLEPLFGLAVNGRVRREHLLTNAGARPGDVLLLSKPLGTGILATALKRGLIDPAHLNVLRDLMLHPNTIGAKLGEIPGVHALTDVTGFGLIGHLLGMCEASGSSATLYFDKVPLIGKDILKPYLDAFVIPDNTFRNFSSYNGRFNTLSGLQMQVLFDPQTSGGLLISLSEEALPAVNTVAEELEITLSQIGFIRSVEPGAASEIRVE